MHISRLGESRDFKFGQNIHRVHLNKSPLKFGEKGAWAYPGTAQIFWIPPIISGTGEATEYILQMWQVHSRGPFE